MPLPPSHPLSLSHGVRAGPDGEAVGGGGGDSNQISHSKMLSGTTAAKHGHTHSHTFINEKSELFQCFIKSKTNKHAHSV